MIVWGIIDKEGMEYHGIVLGADVVLESGTKAPSDFSVKYQAGAIDLRLPSSNKCIDTGCILPNINDEYSGSAPDMGAYERGKGVPHYGPRKAQ